MLLPPPGRARLKPPRLHPERALALFLIAAPAGAGQPADCEAAVQEADWARAVPACEAALEEQPDSFGLRYFLGYAHQALGDWVEAASAWETFLAAVEAEPEAGERAEEQVDFAVRSVGLAHARAGDPEAAAFWLRRAAGEDREDPEVAFWLGVSLQDSEPEEAEAAFRTVIRGAPEIAEAYFLLGRLRYRAGAHDEAEPWLSRYLETDGSGAFTPEAHWLAASIALRGEGDAEEAALHFAAYLEAGGEGSQAGAAHYFLGNRAADSGDCAAALGHFRRFLELLPDDPRSTEVREYVEAAEETCEAG